MMIRESVGKLGMFATLIDNLRQTPSFRAGKDSKGHNPVSVAVQHTVELWISAHRRKRLQNTMDSKAYSSSIAFQYLVVVCEEGDSKHL